MKAFAASSSLPGRPRARRPVELAGARDDLLGLLRCADIAFVHVDARLQIQGITPSARALLADGGRLIGRPLALTSWRLTDPGLIADVRKVLLQGLPSETDVMADDGRCFARRIWPVPSSSASSGRPGGVIITYYNVTRRRLTETALRASEEQHRQILGSITEYAILLLDPQGRLLNWSTSAERIFGYTSAEALGQTLTLFCTDDERLTGVLLKRDLELARRQNGLTIERWHTRKGGVRFWATGVLSALHDEQGGVYGYVRVLRDNTGRKLAEEKLRQAKIDADMANSAKDSFLANISHELRTPLAATLLWAKLLTTRRSLSPAQLRDGLHAIEKSANEQHALIEELMDTSRIATGKLNLELKEVNLAAILKKAAHMIRPATIDRDLRFTVRISPRAGIVKADPLRLQQVLGNLLSNAVKFTPRKGRIRLQLKRLGAEVEIKVSDTGKGISRDFVGRIFDRFTQEDQATIRVNGGLGLGLSIARHLVELHDGTISVHSDGLGKGATFTVRLPLPAVAPTPRPPAKRKLRAPSLHGRRVLLVEDTNQTRLALTLVLASAGATVVAASTAKDALRRFSEECPDLVLSDIGLGEANGFDLISQIRLLERARRKPPVPAVALTAYAGEHTEALALRSGFQQVLIKPVLPADVVRALASALARA